MPTFVAVLLDKDGKTKASVISFAHIVIIEPCGKMVDGSARFMIELVTGRVVYGVGSPDEDIRSFTKKLMGIE